MTHRRWIYAAFVISGAAGLVYEVLWTRYLGLYVGHAAYAQTLVLAVYLGGMAVGALSVARFSRRVADPLRAYAAAEAILAVFGLLFHPLFVSATELSYDVLFPALGFAGGVGALRWAIAGLLVLPQAVVLGATFPFMAAGVVRADLDHPGRGVAWAYLLNTLGGAAGVLLAGFFLIGRFGLPGTSVAAAGMNLAAAAIVFALAQRPVAAVAVRDAAPGAARPDGRAEARTAPGPEPERAPRTQAAGARVIGAARLQATLLAVAFATALASFAYEIGWIRMLSLVLGSATHSFELMLSAFILGLALGSWAVREATDRTPDPIRLLGTVQVLMGVAAALSLPLYVLSFDVMAALVENLPRDDAGYRLFNVSRYGLCLLVMLPATVLAGATLPLITAALLRAGFGEGAIGRVYGVNTVGSVAGAGLAALVLLPLLGLEGLVLAGAALDVLVGLWLLAPGASPHQRTWRPVALAGAAALLVLSSVGLLTELSAARLTSGVYSARDFSAEQRLSLYFEHGRTSTVSAHIGRADGVIVLATNGKPDASIGPRWIMEGRDTLPVRPIPAGRDYTTQLLAPTVALAYRPDARTAANIGHGSGMTAAALLTSERLERLVTIEIEPLMVEGSLVFMPANATAFNDPRSLYVFDDAKSYFSYRGDRFDLIFAEPSNPWVSGTSSLFTREFYAQIVDVLSPGGIFAQWMQIYELNDELFLTVLAALDETFPSYRAYLVGDSDVAILARADGPLPEPDWSVLRGARFDALTQGAPPFTPGALNTLLLFDETTLRPLLGEGTEPNSDYRPTLDLGAEKARFLQTYAEGVYSFAESRVSLAHVLSDRPLPPAPYSLVPAYGLTPAVLAGRAAWLREALAAGGGIAPEAFPEWSEELQHLRRFLEQCAGDEPPRSWEAWAIDFTRAEAALHWGTHGWIDERFYEVVDRYLEATQPPDEARAAVALPSAFALNDWEGAARAADRLVGPVALGRRWTVPASLLDMAVIAYTRVDRPGAARSALSQLAPRTGLPRGHLRLRLLEALVDEAAAAR